MVLGRAALPGGLRAARSPRMGIAGNDDRVARLVELLALCRI